MTTPCCRRTRCASTATSGWLCESCAGEPRTSTATAPEAGTRTSSTKAQADPTTQPMSRDDDAVDCPGCDYSGGGGVEQDPDATATATETREGRARRALYQTYLPAQLRTVGFETCRTRCLGTGSGCVVDGGADEVARRWVAREGRTDTAGGAGAYVAFGLGWTGQGMAI